MRVTYERCWSTRQLLWKRSFFPFFAVVFPRRWKPPVTIRTPIPSKAKTRHCFYYVLPFFFSGQPPLFRGWASSLCALQVIFEAKKQYSTWTMPLIRSPELPSASSEGLYTTPFRTFPFPTTLFQNCLRRTQTPQAPTIFPNDWSFFTKSSFFLSHLADISCKSSTIVYIPPPAPLASARVADFPLFESSISHFNFL